MIRIFCKTISFLRKLNCFQKLKKPDIFNTVMKAYVSKLSMVIDVKCFTQPASLWGVGKTTHTSLGYFQEFKFSLIILVLVHMVHWFYQFSPCLLQLNSEELIWWIGPTQHRGTGILHLYPNEQTADLWVEVAWDQK